MKKVIVTVGPSLFANTTLKEIDAENYIYRVNGAHGSVADIAQYIKKIRTQLPEAKIMVDLPGNKIRTANLEQPIRLEKEKKFKLTAHQINYPLFYQYLNSGDVVFASDSTLKFVVEDVKEEGITFLSQSEGALFTNKGLHIKGLSRRLPFLFQKDTDLIRLANESKISYVGLSFVRDGQDINSVKKQISPDITVISKVETKSAVENIDSILDAVEYILVDRGDLSSEIGLEKIPSYQKYIIEKAHFHNKKVFLSTQFLKNMEDKPVPTIAEIIDLYNTFKMGVYGIQLSEETAIGKYPRECLDIINRVIQEIGSEVI